MRNATKAIGTLRARLPHHCCAGTWYLVLVPGCMCLILKYSSCYLVVNLKLRSTAYLVITAYDTFKQALRAYATCIQQLLRYLKHRYLSLHVSVLIVYHTIINNSSTRSTSRAGTMSDRRRARKLLFHHASTFISRSSIFFVIILPSDELLHQSYRYMNIFHSASNLLIVLAIRQCANMSFNVNHTQQNIPESRKKSTSKFILTTINTKQEVVLVEHRVLYSLQQYNICEQYGMHNTTAASGINY